MQVNFITAKHVAAIEVSKLEHVSFKLPTKHSIAIKLLNLYDNMGEKKYDKVDINIIPIIIVRFFV